MYMYAVRMQCICMQKNREHFINEGGMYSLILQGGHVDDDDKKDALIQGPLVGTQRG